MLGKPNLPACGADGRAMSALSSLSQRPRAVQGRRSPARTLEGVDAPADALDERAQRVLEFERAWWGHSGAKELGIRREFGWSAARYYQVLNAVIDTEVAVRYDPVLVGRLRAVRDERAQRRRTRRAGEPGAA